MRSSNRKALNPQNSIKANIDLAIVEQIFGEYMDPSDKDLERRVYNAIYKRHPFPTAFTVMYPSDNHFDDGTTYIGITGEVGFMQATFGIMPKIGTHISISDQKLYDSLQPPDSWHDPKQLKTIDLTVNDCLTTNDLYDKTEFEDLFDDTTKPVAQPGA